jgi:hypothetical protein
MYVTVLLLLPCSGRCLIIAPALVQNPGGLKSGVGTPYSVTEFISKNTDELLKEAVKEGFGKRKQEILKALVCRQVHQMIHC